VGLHHLALRVADAASLDTLHERLLATDETEIEFAPEPLGTSGMRHMMTRIPGGLRIEFVAAAPPAVD
jgi:hypothetical protein